ncbi:hypothetical protein D3C85_668100 [compost metagenome]
MQRNLVREGHRDPGTQLATGARQVVVEYVVIDFDFVVLGELMHISGTDIRLYNLALAQIEIASGGYAQLAEQRASTVTVSSQAIVQVITLALDHHARQLRVRLDEVVIGQLDMPPELQGPTDTVIVVTALGFAAVAEPYIGLVLETVELQHTVEVVTAHFIQPGRVGTDVVTVHRTAAAMAQIEIGLAVTAQQTHQPLAVTDR